LAGDREGVAGKSYASIFKNQLLDWNDKRSLVVKNKFWREERREMGGATQRAKREEMLTARRASSKNDTPIFVRKEAMESKFSEASTGLLDWQIYRAAQTPGPGEYGSGRPLPLPNGGRFSKFKPKGYCDDLIKRAMGTPGPAGVNVVD